MRRSPAPASEEGPFPLSLAEFARRVGRSKSSVTEAFQNKLVTARLPSGRVDARHPVVTAWCVDRGVDPTVLTQPITVVRAAPHRDESAPAPATPTGTAPSSSPSRSPTLLRGGFDDPPNAEALLDMTMRQIARRFGSLTGFSDYLDVRRKSADCRRIELQNATREGALIEREFVRVHVLALIESTYRKLLSDTPKTLSMRAYAAIKAGATVEEVEQTIRELLSATLGELKERATRALRPVRKSEDAA